MSARGADVTLFATGNSRAAVKIAAVVPVGLEEDRARNADVYSALHIGKLFERAADFDLIHNNFDWKPLTYALATAAPPMITTIHGFSSPPILAAYYAGAARSFYCSISDADRDPGLAYLATTYNGIDPSAWTYRAEPGADLVFLGRFHPEKGAHLAIAIAKKAGLRLKLAAIPQDDAYFKELVEPHIDGDRIQFLGHVQGTARDELLGTALALVHMTTRPERFGLTMIEAMACGTPVIAFDNGSVPEVLQDGVTGFIVRSEAQASNAVHHIGTLDRNRIRAEFESRFTAQHMAQNYLKLYARLIKSRLKAPAMTADRMTQGASLAAHAGAMAAGPGLNAIAGV